MDYAQESYRENVLKNVTTFQVDTWGSWLLSGELGNLATVAPNGYLWAAYRKSNIRSGVPVNFNVNAESILDFKTYLSEAIAAHLKNYPGFGLELNVEYQPDRTLHDAAERAGIHPFAFPLKTFTSFYFNERTAPHLLLRGPNGKRYWFDVTETGSVSEEPREV